MRPVSLSFTDFFVCRFTIVFFGRNFVLLLVRHVVSGTYFLLHIIECTIFSIGAFLR